MKYTRKVFLLFSGTAVNSHPSLDKLPAALVGQRSCWCGGRAGNLKMKRFKMFHLAVTRKFDVRKFPEYGNMITLHTHKSATYTSDWEYSWVHLRVLASSFASTRNYPRVKRSWGLTRVFACDRTHSHLIHVLACDIASETSPFHLFVELRLSSTVCSYIHLLHYRSLCGLFAVPTCPNRVGWVNRLWRKSWHFHNTS